MSQTQAFFDRIVKLKVFNQQTSKNSDGSLSIAQTDKTGREFVSRFPDNTPGFRIKFRIDKVAATTSAIPNAATISIYNLGPDSRPFFEVASNLLILEAGHGNSAKQVFRGEVMWGKTEKHGSDYITEIQAADGLFAFQNARVNLAFNKGLTANQAINTLVGALKPAGIGTGTITGVPSAGYNGGLVLTGKAVDRLKEVCEKHDLSFSIQDGNVLILPYGGDRGAPAQLISEDTGMIGIPQKRSQDVTGAATILSVKSLLLPDLGVYQKIAVSSKFVNGLYTTARVTQDGDSWEGPFYTEIEAA